MADPQEPGAVTGYRTQSAEDIDLVNEIKALENTLGAKIELLAQRDDVDPRMLELGRTRLQEGFMWTVRAIFQPESRL